MNKKNNSLTNEQGKLIAIEEGLIYQDNHIVLRNVSYTIGEGEFHYLTGKVGSGKSSFLKTLYGELAIKDGNAFVCGYYLDKLKSKDIPYLRRRMGIVFQDFQLLEERSVYDNLSFVLQATGWKNKKERDVRIREVLTHVDMVHKATKLAHQLSGGEQQRIAIARSLLNNPKLILADEPTGNLDPTTSDELMRLLHALVKEGMSVIMATHNYTLLKKFPAKLYRCEDCKLFEVEQEEIELDML